MILKFKVNNQKLEITNKDTYLADKSNNIITAQFNITGDDWKNKQIFVLLRDNQCNTYQLHLPENYLIPIPYTVLEQEAFSISLYGEDDEETRITTNMVNFRLNPSGYTTDIKDLEDVDPDIWTQIWEGIDSKSDLGHEHIVADIRDFPKLSEVAYSGEYNDLLHAPRFSKVASTGEYDDLNNTPDIPYGDEETIINTDSMLSVKSKSIGLKHLTSTVKDSLSYADDYNNGPASNISDEDIINWDNKQDDNLVTSLDNADNTSYPSSKCVKDYIDNAIGDIEEDMRL